ncbi:MAG TPA: oligosaccharide flippase family protein [Steroidobacteraceae bacterium]|nr:oligosaccharide flippase family protein [Steroidobacteraceae bacterium]
MLSKVAGLGALTAAGQLLVVGTLPLYSRTFDPAAYGEYIVFVGAYAIVSVFAGLRYDSAIVLPRSQGMAQALSLLVVALGLLVAALIALATPGLVIASSASPATKGAELNLGYGLAVATVLGALQRCLTSWCIRRSRFLSMGWAQFLFSLITVIAQLSLVRLIPQLPALVWGYVGALLGQLLWLAAAVPGAFTRSRPSWRALRVVARKYRRFPRYMVGYALASSVRDRLIQLAFGLGAGAAVLGRFGLAYRVMFAPNSLIYSAVSPVFYSLASRGRPEAVGRFAADLVEASFVALVTPYVALAIEAPALTEVTLSAKWHGTGPYLQALAAPALMLAVTCWLDRAFDSFRRQKIAFVLEASFTAVSVALVAVLSLCIDPVAVVWAFGALALVYYWVYALGVFVSCGFRLADLRRAMAQGLLSLSIALVLALLVHRIAHPEIRLLSYLGLMGAVLAAWVRLQGGADIIMRLARSRAASDST